MSRPPTAAKLSAHAVDRNKKVSGMWDRQDVRKQDITTLHNKQLEGFENKLAAHKNALCNFTTGVAHLRRENNDVFQKQNLRLTNSTAEASK